jgi:proline iminopeptidase
MQFAAETASGAIVGEYASGGGEPALILHGGPGMSDYTEPLADELSRSFRAIRYQQRGKSPSTTTGPLTVEAHVADALAVLDDLGLERAWAVGHSWGGYLAMHVAAAEPQRVSGLVAIGTLGAVGDGGLATFDATIKASFREHYGRPPADDEPFELWWPLYFPQPSKAPPFPRIETTGPEETWESLRHHFQRRTLVDHLPAFRGPALFVHGRRDPLPCEASLESAELIDGARVELVEECGHWPWLEWPGSVAAAVGTLL